MCGIVGYSNKLINSESIQRVFKNTLNKLNHRGPDSQDYFSDKKNNFICGMTRLSILDHEYGYQPFYSDDKRFALVFNGEIVNFKSLRSYLEEKKKIKFKSKNSDTEVLLQLLINDGLDCLQSLNGMFAFCLYDFKKNKAILARDRFGIKPLYYFLEKNLFGFSSEVKNLVSFYPNEIKINKQSLSDYLSLMYIPSPNTIFENINRLSAGEILEIDLNNSSYKKKKWFEPNFRPDNKISAEDVIENIKNISKKAINEWSLSDVPISNSLSGGIDSSTISYLAKNQKINITNFTLGFKDRIDGNFDEVELAKNISESFNQNHEVFKISGKDFLSQLDDILEDIHEPYGGGLPSWMVYKNISKNFKVAFNGIGVDEFFGNYSKWKNMKSFWSKEINYEKFCKNFFNKRYYATNFEKKKILNFNLNNIESTSLNFYNKFQDGTGTIEDKSALLDIKTQLTDEFLNICDAFSMSFSLEARPFYLDKNLTDFFFKIPSNIRVGKHNDLKYIFKKSFVNHLPKEILSGTKKGFILPIENWLKKDLKELTLKFFSKKKLDEHGFFQSSEINNLANQFFSRSKLSSHFDKFHRLQTLIWGILMFQLWFEKNINKREIIL